MCVSLGKIDPWGLQQNSVLASSSSQAPFHYHLWTRLFEPGRRWSFHCLCWTQALALASSEQYFICPNHRWIRSKTIWFFPAIQLQGDSLHKDQVTRKWFYSWWPSCFLCSSGSLISNNEDSLQVLLTFSCPVIPQTESIWTRLHRCGLHSRLCIPLHGICILTTAWKYDFMLTVSHWMRLFLLG